MQPFPNPDADTTNRHATTTFSQPFPQPSCNRFPTPRQPSGTSTRLQPSFNRHATASQSQPRLNCYPITFQPPESAKRTIPRLANHPRLNHPSCRIQERFRLNHPTSTILESTTSSCMALARSSIASAVASLPAPPATRSRSPSCWKCCHERCRRRETQTRAK